MCRQKRTEKMQRKFATAAAAALVFAAPLFAAPALAAAKRPAAELVPDGKPVPCINTSQIRNTSVIDDKTIDFHMNGGRIMRNNLPAACPSLGFDKTFGYRTSISQLCNVDIITVIHAGEPRRGASCGLGMFTPMKKVEPAPAK